MYPSLPCLPSQWVIVCRNIGFSTIFGTVIPSLERGMNAHLLGEGVECFMIVFPCMSLAKTCSVRIFPIVQSRFMYWSPSACFLKINIINMWTWSFNPYIFRGEIIVHFIVEEQQASKPKPSLAIWVIRLGHVKCSQVDNIRKCKFTLLKLSHCIFTILNCSYKK